MIIIPKYKMESSQPQYPFVEKPYASRFGTVAGFINLVVLSTINQCTGHGTGGARSREIIQLKP
jgi:hypothetical protein